MILIDTSAWVEYDRATGSPIDQRLTELINNDSRIAVTEPVIMEVVAGARGRQHEHDLRRLMQRCALLRFDASVDFDAAARIYLACRAKGIAPRGMVDCMIASVAHRYRASLLALDVDLARVADVIGIELDEASSRA
ncbi:MAG: PIN domain nuclease [Acidimicrobiales bacterium]